MVVIETIQDPRVPKGKSWVMVKGHHAYIYVHPDGSRNEEIVAIATRRLLQIHLEQFSDT